MFSLREVNGKTNVYDILCMGVSTEIFIDVLCRIGYSTTILAEDDKCTITPEDVEYIHLITKPIYSDFEETQLSGFSLFVDFSKTKPPLYVGFVEYEEMTLSLLCRELKYWAEQKGGLRL